MPFNCLISFYRDHLESTRLAKLRGESEFVKIAGA